MNKKSIIQMTHSSAFQIHKRIWQITYRVDCVFFFRTYVCGLEGEKKGLALFGDIISVVEFKVPRGHMLERLTEKNKR